MHKHEHKVDIIKRNPIRRIMQSVLALFREKVSIFKASRRLSPNSSLLKLGVRSYTACHVRVLTISDEEKISYAK
jgi:hypothetical protein